MMNNPEISDQIQAAIIAQDTIDAIAQLEISINDDTCGVVISPTAIYCQKTGHKIGARDENSLFSLMKIHGKNRFVNSLYEATTLAVHPAWIWTDGDTLDNLIDADPIGYACYCFGLITAQFYQNHKNHDPNRSTVSERYWAMARANAILTARGVGELATLNVELCKLLTYAPSTLSCLFRTIRKYATAPDNLAILASTGELTEILHDVTVRVLNSIGIADSYIKRTRFMDFSATPADAARGPSNVRKQRASKRAVKEDTMLTEMLAAFDAAGVFKKAPIDLKKWQNKYRAGIETKEQAAEHELLAAFAEVNLNEISAENDADENDVEMRVIKLAPVPEQTTPIIAPIQKPLTALERLRMKKS